MSRPGITIAVVDAEGDILDGIETAIDRIIESRMDPASETAGAAAMEAVKELHIIKSNLEYRIRCAKEKDATAEGTVPS